MKQYKSLFVKTAFSKSGVEKKLDKILNDMSADGWDLVQTVGNVLIFARETP